VCCIVFQARSVVCNRFFARPDFFARGVQNPQQRASALGLHDQKTLKTIALSSILEKTLAGEQKLK